MFRFYPLFIFPLQSLSGGTLKWYIRELLFYHRRRYTSFSDISFVICPSLGFRTYLTANHWTSCYDRPPSPFNTSYINIDIIFVCHKICTKRYKWRNMYDFNHSFIHLSQPSLLYIYITLSLYLSKLSLLTVSLYLNPLYYTPNVSLYLNHLYSTSNFILVSKPYILYI